MKNLLRVLLFAASGILIACTFFAALATPVAVIETSTPFSLIMPTKQVTLPYLPTLPPATATIPYVVIGTFTPTPIPTTVTVNVESTAKGDYLNISRSTDKLEYRLGPVAHGAYAIGPNDKFLVYCTNGGDVYAAKLGAQYLTQIGNVRKFSAIERNVPPNLQLVIFLNNGRYKVDIRERRFNQNEVFVISGKFTE